MRAPDGRTYARDGAAERDRSSRKNIDILKRRTEKPVDIPKASGGVTGVTRCTAGAISQSNGGSSTLFFTDWTFATLPGGSDSPAMSDAGGGSLAIGDSGLFEWRAYVQLSWNVSGGPPQFQLQVGWTDAPDPTPDWKCVLASADLLGGGGPSLRDVFSWGPVHHAAGDEVFLGGSWSTSGTAFLSGVAVDVWRVG